MPGMVQEFVERCVESAGGAAEERGPGLLDVLTPPPLEPVAGGRLLLPLALDTEALRQEPGAELATIGSPVLDALIDYALAQGTTAFGYLIPEHIRKKGMREEVEHSIVFSNGRVRYTPGEPDIFLAAYAQFNFRVQFLSDERRERNIVIPVNLWSGQVSRGLAARLPHLNVVADRPGHYSDAPRIPLDQARRIAIAALHGSIREEAGRHEARIRKHFTVEFLRIDSYYEQVAQELRRRQEREDDEKKARALEAKRTAADEEKVRKLRELGLKYRLRPRARLMSARILAQPKSFYKVQVDRGKATRTVTVVYDSLLERLEPPVCDTCHLETARIHIDSDLRLLCPDCSAGKAGS